MVARSLSNGSSLPLRDDFKSVIWHTRPGFLERLESRPRVVRASTRSLWQRDKRKWFVNKKQNPPPKKLSPEQKIAQRAYEIYLERNGARKSRSRDWGSRAETRASSKEITQKRQENGQRRSVVPARQSTFPLGLSPKSPLYVAERKATCPVVPPVPVPTLRPAGFLFAHSSIPIAKSR